MSRRDLLLALIAIVLLLVCLLTPAPTTAEREVGTGATYGMAIESGDRFVPPGGPVAVRHGR